MITKYYCCQWLLSAPVLYYDAERQSIITGFTSYIISIGVDIYDDINITFIIY